MMKIEVWSDIMCPFCYIGKRNYENAISQFKNSSDIQLIWKSFQLDPTIPEENVTIDAATYLANRKGLRVEQVMQMYKNVEESAQKAGLSYDLKNTIPANSFKAHRIIQLAKEKELGNYAEEQFFIAHFIDFKDLNNEGVLIEIGKEIGLTEKEVQHALTDEKYTQLVKKDIAEANQLGVTGVPFFVFDRKYAISGAQPPEVFLETLEKTYSEWKKENNKLDVINGESCSTDGTCN